jgi:hypothetical protein
MTKIKNVSLKDIVRKVRFNGWDGNKKIDKSRS